MPAVSATFPKPRRKVSPMTVASPSRLAKLRQFRFGDLARRLSLIGAAGAVALAGLGASARPAEADADDLFRFLAGAIVIGAIVNSIDDNHTAPYYGGRELPGSCRETIRVNGRNVDSFNQRCLNRSGYHNLPGQCRYEFRVSHGRTRTGFIAECLYEAGWRVHDGPRWGNDRGPRHDGYGYSGRPPRVEQQGRWLPQHCSMTYRQDGRRVDGYWGSCLRDSGLRDMPGYCRVTSTSGDRIFNARCLRDAGYRGR